MGIDSSGLSGFSTNTNVHPFDRSAIGGGGGLGALNGSLGAPGGGLYPTPFMDSMGDSVQINSTFEASSFNEKYVEAITNTVHAVQRLNDGWPHAQWHTLIDPKNPEESASRINAMLSKGNPSSEVYASLAACMMTASSLPIITFLEERHMKRVRDLVLQESMEHMKDVPGDRAVPIGAEILVEAARLQLVRLKGLLSVVQNFLETPDCRRAGVAVLGGVLNQQRHNKEFIETVLSCQPMMLQLYNLHSSPEFEYDVLAITQLLTEGSSTAQLQHPVLLRGPVLPSRGAPPTRIQYFGASDELLSAYLDGTVVLWGAPGPNGVVEAKGTLEMPNDCIPWAMAGSRQGSYMVLSGKPLLPPLSDSAFGQYFQHRKQQELNSGKGVAVASHNPVLRILAYNEPSRQWGGGEIIQRPLNSTLTAVAALPNSIVCSAESFSLQHHDITLFNAATGQAIRTIAGAHKDFTTVLATCPDTLPIFFSGSRDKTVKLFDMRSPMMGEAVLKPGSAQNASGAYQLDHMFSDVVSAVVVHPQYVFTASLDGSLLRWDRRQLNTPISRRSFPFPVLDLATMGAVDNEPMVAVSTTRGLFLVRAPSLVSIDIVPNRCFTQLTANEDGSVLFAADAEGISTFSLKK